MGLRSWISHTHSCSHNNSFELGSIEGLYRYAYSHIRDGGGRNWVPRVGWGSRTTPEPDYPCPQPWCEENAKILRRFWDPSHMNYSFVNKVNVNVLMLMLLPTIETCPWSH
ncbi:putative WD repeat-containing protein C26H5.03 [Fusarium oxysporum f. sp. albedinis]|nr:putative WD repeat-containing protein C26H5.03 [Fusarium oxysporum f. sp. albedinis]